VPARVSPVERVRAEIDELFASEQELGQVLEQVARLSVRLVMQAALEAEVTEFLGRDRYVRGERDRAGYRNGHAELQVKTTAGPVVLQRPKVRGTDQPFASRLLGKGVSRTNALEALVLSGFVRGLSVRDVEAALAEALGPEAALSKSTVSRICEVIKTEFDAWKHRDLTGVELEYLYLDGSHFRMHPQARAEPVLCAWGITTQGAPLLVGLAPASDEGHDPWAGFLGELVARGLRPPLLVITDGAPGLIGAVEIGFPNSLRQRCLIHRTRKETRCRHAGVRGGGRGVTEARNSVACDSGFLHRYAHARIPHQQAPKTENDTLFPYGFTCAATSPPRSPSTPRTRSSGTTGRSSTTLPASPATRRWPRPASGRTPSPTATTGAIPLRSPACWTPCPS
jgi:putative transposase